MTTTINVDVCVIGAGLSGLASAVRMGQQGMSVVVVEAHNTAGGMNSYYQRPGKTIDVGLHAMTNFMDKSDRSAPFNRIFRALKIPRDSLQLAEQKQSRAVVPGGELIFTNDFNVLDQQIKSKFPADYAGFQRLADSINNTDIITSGTPEGAGIRQIISDYINNPILSELLMLPVFYYGAASTDDMVWRQFCLVWKSIYTSGFCRPAAGISPLIEALVSKINDTGKILYNTRVTKLNHAGKTIVSASLDSGQTITAKYFFSCAGQVETERLIAPGTHPPLTPGKISVVELLVELKSQPQPWVGADTCVFISEQIPFRWRCPDTLVDHSSCIVVVPGNYQYPTGVQSNADKSVRISSLASYAEWRKLLQSGAGDSEDKSRYRLAKKQQSEILLQRLDNLYPGISQQVVWTELFTPLTLERYTLRCDGALYGYPEKNRTGNTEFDNLYIVGADQGFHGITGALLSGVTIASQVLL